MPWLLSVFRRFGVWVISWMGVSDLEDKLNSHRRMSSHGSLLKRTIKCPFLIVALCCLNALSLNSIACTVPSGSQLSWRHCPFAPLLYDARSPPVWIPGGHPFRFRERFMSMWRRTVVLFSNCILVILWLHRAFCVVIAFIPLIFPSTEQSLTLRWHQRCNLYNSFSDTSKLELPLLLLVGAPEDIDHHVAFWASLFVVLDRLMSLPPKRPNFSCFVL